MIVTIPIDAGIAPEIRSSRNGEYEQFFELTRVIKRGTPYQETYPLGTYSGGESVPLKAEPEFCELDVECKFLHHNMQLSKVKHKATNRESLWTIWADDSHDDYDYNDLIVQVDLGNNFNGIVKLVPVEIPQ